MYRRACVFDSARQEEYPRQSLRDLSRFQPRRVTQRPRNKIRFSISTRNTFAGLQITKMSTNRAPASSIQGGQERSLSLFEQQRELLLGEIAIVRLPIPIRREIVSYLAKGHPQIMGHRA
jgi:hypothetical protein